MLPSDKKLRKKGLLASVGVATAMFAASMGIPMERIYKKAGLEPSDLMDLEGRILDESFIRILQLLAKIQPKKNISLSFARVLPYSSLGMPWRFYRQAENARVMLNLFALHYDLFSDQVEVSLIESSDEIRIRLDHRLDDIDEGLGAELGMAMIHRIAKEFFGESLLKQIFFRHSPRSSQSQYDDYFAIPVVFENEYNEAVIGLSKINLPNIKNSTLPRIILEQQLNALRLEMGVDVCDGLEDVRAAIEKNIAQRIYSVQGLAKSMAVSMRNLQRRLHKNGTSASILIDEVRHIQAMELLHDKDLSIDQIAESLGFSCDRSFRKAFDRWAEMSPAEARKVLVSPK